MNGVAAPLYYVSPTQINLQVPWQTTVGSSATLVVNNNGQVASQTFNVSAVSPGIFMPIGSAAHGQITTLYMAGTGAVTPPIATGYAPSLSTPLSDSPRARQHYGYHRRRAGLDHLHRHPVLSGRRDADQLHNPVQCPDRHATNRCQRKRHARRDRLRQRDELVPRDARLPFRTRGSYPRCAARAALYTSFVFLIGSSRIRFPVAAKIALQIAVYAPSPVRRARPHHAGGARRRSRNGYASHTALPAFSPPGSC